MMAIGTAHTVGHEEYRTGEELLETLRARAHSFVDERKGALSDRIRDLARAAAVTGDELERQDQSGLARYVRGAADRLEAVSRTVREREAADLADDLRSFARAHPVPLLSAAFLAGVVVVRLLRQRSGPDRSFRDTRPYGDEIRSDTYEGTGSGAAGVPLG